MWYKFGRKISKYRYQLKKIKNLRIKIISFSFEIGKNWYNEKLKGAWRCGVRNENKNKIKGSSGGNRPDGMWRQNGNEPSSAHQAQGTTVHLQSFVHHGTHAIPFGTLWGLLFKSSVRNIFLLSLALSGPYHYGRPFNNIPGLILWAQYSY